MVPSASITASLLEILSPFKISLKTIPLLLFVSPFYPPVNDQYKKTKSIKTQTHRISKKQRKVHRLLNLTYLALIILRRQLAWPYYLTCLPEVFTLKFRLLALSPFI
jgi:hypothetical protein